MSAGDRFEPLRQYVWSELDRRNWSMVRLSREAGISHSTISNVLNHVSAPTLRFFQCMAQAFRVEIVDLLVLAGYIPPRPPVLAQEEQLLAAFRRLDPGHRVILLAIARVMPQPEQAIEILPAVLEEPEPYQEAGHPDL